MRFHGLDLNLLVALDALMSELSVTGAGARLHLSQSAMSCALARLRTQLGDPLLVPSGQRMVATPYGEVLARRVRELLVQVDATIRARPDFDPRTSTRHFTIAASDYAVNVLLVDVQRRLDALAPQTTLEILPIIDSTVSSLRHGEIDFAIVPDHYRFAECPDETLFRDRLVCIAAADNAAVGATITLAQFAQLDQVVYQPDAGHVIAFDAWLRQRHRIDPQVRVWLPNYSLLPQAVAGTRRIATVPARLAEIYARTLPLKIALPDFEMPAMVEILHWHGARVDDTGLAWLRGIIGGTAAALAQVPPLPRARRGSARQAMAAKEAPDQRARVDLGRGAKLRRRRSAAA